MFCNQLIIELIFENSEQIEKFANPCLYLPAEILKSRLATEFTTEDEAKF